MALTFNILIKQTFNKKYIIQMKRSPTNLPAYFSEMLDHFYYILCMALTVLTSQPLYKCLILYRSAPCVCIFIFFTQFAHYLQQRK